MISATIVLFIFSSCFSQCRLVSAQSSIKNLDQAISEAKATIRYTKIFSDQVIPTATFIAFPEKVPASKTKTIASFVTYKRFTYAISVDVDSPECHPIFKLCNIGTLSFGWSGNPTIYYDGDNKKATTLVNLHKGIQGFFTRGFPMADYWPANIQWRDQEILYTLTWPGIYEQNQNAVQNDLVQMANSVIDQLHRQ